MTRVSRERAKRLVDLVFEANAALGSGYNIGFEIEKHSDELTIWMERENVETNFFVYATMCKSYKNQNIMSINDPNLEKGEEHVRRLMEEKKEEENDTL